MKGSDMDFYLIGAIILTTWALVSTFLYVDATREIRNIRNINENLAEQLKKNLDRPKSIELKEFLRDLMSGEALVSVARVDSNDLFTLSPRDAK
jgi:hypothetical protein